MSDRPKPAIVFPPSDFLREELEAREWTISDLGREMGGAEHYARSLVKGGHRITRVAAMMLEQALGTSAEFWLNLQASYDEGVKDGRVE